MGDGDVWERASLISIAHMTYCWSTKTAKTLAGCSLSLRVLIFSSFLGSCFPLPSVDRSLRPSLQFHSYSPFPHHLRLPHSYFPSNLNPVISLGMSAISRDPQALCKMFALSR